MRKLMSHRVVSLGIVFALCGSVLHAPVDEAYANVAHMGRQGVNALMKAAPHLKRWGPLLMTFIGAIGTVCKGDLSSRCLRSVQGHLVASGKMTLDDVRQLHRALKQPCGFMRVPIVCDAFDRVPDEHVLTRAVTERKTAQRTRPTSSQNNGGGGHSLPPGTSGVPQTKQCAQLFAAMERQLKAMQDWKNALKTFDVPTKDGDKIDQKMIKDIFDHLNSFYNKNAAQIKYLLQLPQTPKQANTVFTIMRGTNRSPDQLIALLDALRHIPVSPDQSSPFSKYGPVRTIVDSDALQKSGWITYLKMSGEDKKKLWQKVQADIDFLRDYVDSEKSIFDAEKTCAYAQSVLTLINSTIDRYQTEYPFLIKKNNMPFSVQGVQSSLVGLFQRITLRWGAFFTNVKNMVASNFGVKR